MHQVITELASIANSGALSCLIDMKCEVLEEQIRDRIKSLAIGRMNDNNEILNVSVLPQVTGRRLGNLIQMSIEAKRLGEEKRYISKLFSKDKFLEHMADKEIQIYEKRICNKLKNMIENALKLSNDGRVKEIAKKAFHDSLNIIESKNSATALVDKNIGFDDNFYSEVGCNVKEAPELYSGNVEQKNMESWKNQKEELSPEMGKGLEKFRKNINEFWKSAEIAARKGKLESLEVDNTAFFLEYSENSTIDVAKIRGEARDLGLTQGSIQYGRNIMKIDESEVEIITQKGIRNYIDLADNSDMVLTFCTSKRKLEVRLYSDTQNNDVDNSLYIADKNVLSETTEPCVIKKNNYEDTSSDEKNVLQEQEKSNALKEIKGSTGVSMNNNDQGNKKIPTKVTQSKEGYNKAEAKFVEKEKISEPNDQVTELTNTRDNLENIKWDLEKTKLQLGEKNRELDDAKRNVLQLTDDLRQEQFSQKGK